MPEPRRTTAQAPIAARPRRLLRGSNLLTLAGNLVPLAGVLFWRWDSFQILMLYWLETVNIAVWSLLRIAKLQKPMMGKAADDSTAPAMTNKQFAGFFALIIGSFILAHLIFLLAFLSGDWMARVSGPASFVYRVVFASGAWLALLFMIAAGGIAYAMAPPQAAWIEHVERTIYPDRARAETDQDAASTNADWTIFKLFGRIVVMQITIVLGAVASQYLGSIAPILVIVGLKSAIDFISGGYGAIASRASTALRPKQRRSA